MGIQVGDIILSYDGVDIEDDDHLINQVKLTPLDKEVVLVVFRDGQDHGTQSHESVPDRAASK